jgi:two-component system, LytTR family, sensor histidine kinase AlgZ
VSASIDARLRQSALALARDLWVYVLLAGLLTILIVSLTHVADAGQISMLFVGNLMISVSVGMACELARALVLARAAVAERPRAQRVLISVPVFAAAVFVGAELGYRLVHALLLAGSSAFQHRQVLLISGPVTLVMVAVGALRELSVREGGRRREAERQLEQARLSALSARTDPHFLFNSLNSIAALIADEPELAERAVLQLAAMFRYVLEGSGATDVRLGDELAFVRDYLALEALRYPDRLTVQLEVDAALHDARVPPLVLQPLVENALRHGLAARPVHLTVAVQIARSGDQLTIAVDDDGPGPGASQHRGARTSQADLRQRLALAYGDRASFETSRSPLGGFRAMLRLPVRTEGR